MIVRFPTLEDLNACVHVDGTVESQYVWQVRHTTAPERIVFTLQRVSLPRPARLPAPDPDGLLQRCYQERAGIWVAVERGNVLGFSLTVFDEPEQLAWIRFLVVDRAHRRRGVGSALLMRAAREAADRRMTRVVVPVSVKNDPAIQFLRHHGFSCVGYHEVYFASGDFALYFGRSLRRWI